jgi:hypothetical protein
MKTTFKLFDLIYYPKFEKVIKKGPKIIITGRGRLLMDPRVKTKKTVTFNKDSQTKSAVNKLIKFYPMGLTLFAAISPILLTSWFICFFEQSILWFLWSVFISYAFGYFVYGFIQLRRLADQLKKILK